ncbi:hypothetical protein KKB64_04570 [Patescibacteria group bacterium]|nr:hypothetical protein [Patescibacteria group bacterium]MBU1473024.1 hypothetical protein [Patescibacteria group bacterium]MBU2460220.1 hypothetical protein [Patescibacteria group bacterium]MBU2543893.1 hypothetical protein [Patescibacteria group bacterium]
MREFDTSGKVTKMLADGKILAPGENPQHMFDRVVDTLFSVESTLGIDSGETLRNKEIFADYMLQGAISPGTPTLTNAGRSEYTNAALSSCVVISVNLRKLDEAAVKIRGYYRQNMGSGFDFTPYDDPVGLLTWLNDLSEKETATGQYDRYIGNMGNLHVSHPRIREFIRAKRDTAMKHFNISVDVSEEFMQAVMEHRSYRLADGTDIDAYGLLKEMSECAHHNGDPGLISLERMNRDNPVQTISSYTSVPPCSEMGLAPGETCQFGYINLLKFSTPEGIDFVNLSKATMSMTRALDNAIEISRNGYPDEESNRLATLKRKIGIGVCGLADTLIQLGIPYGSEEGRTVAQNMLASINFASKVASVQLAEQRGSCNAMVDQDNKYYHGFIESRYAMHPTDSVSKQAWEMLAAHIKKTGHLRNILTTALPPAGRTSILLGVTSSIEPLFSLHGLNDGTQKLIESFIKQRVGDESQIVLDQALEQGTFQHRSLPDEEVLKTVKEIPFIDQLQMVAAVSGVYDEAISKTVNLPHSASVQDVLDVFIDSHRLGLKNITVYKDKSYENQPISL